MILLLCDQALYVLRRSSEGLERLSNVTLTKGLLLALQHENGLVRLKVTSVIGYYIGEQAFSELAFLTANDSDPEVRQSAAEAQLRVYRKLQYFDISFPLITTIDLSPPSPPPPLTAQEREALETQIAAKYQEALNSNDTRQKGKALEELLAAIFTSIAGFTVIECNYRTPTEEIDLVLRNANVEPFWREWGSLLLVEAKNWQAQRVGKNEYVQFYRKLENRGGHCRLGFLICTERFAETFHLEALRDSKQQLRVVPIDGDDLRRLVEATDRATVLREFIERAVLT